MIAISARWQRVLHMLLGVGLLQAANIVTYILLARLLSQVDYGSYRQLFLINQLVWAIAFAAFPTSLLYFSGRARTEMERSTIVRRHLALVAGFAALACGVLLMSGTVVAWLLNNESLAELLPVFAIYPAAYMLTSLAPPVMIAQGRTARLPLLTGTLALLNSVPVVLTAWMDGRLIHIVTAAAVGGALGGVIAAAVILRLSRGPRGQIVEFRQILRYSAPLLAAGAVGLLGLRMDQFAVAQLFGPAVFAIYAVGAFELPLYSLVKSSTSSVLLPELSAAVQSGDWNLVLAVWRDMQRKNTALLLPISAALFAYSEEFITVLFGERYRAAAPIFAILTLLGPVRAVTFALVLRAMGRTEIDLWASLVFLLAVGTSVYPLSYAFGIEAAAMTIVVATTALAVSLLAVTARASGGALAMRALYPPRIILGYGTLVLLFIALRIMTNRLSLEPVFELVLSAALAAALSMVLLRHSRLLVPSGAARAQG